MLNRDNGLPLFPTDSLAGWKPLRLEFTLLAGGLLTTLIVTLLATSWGFSRRGDSAPTAYRAPQAPAAVPKAVSQAVRAASVSMVGTVELPSVPSGARTSPAGLAISAHQRMQVLLDDLYNRRGDHPFSPDNQRAAQAKRLELLNAAASPANLAQRLELMFSLGVLELKMGLEEESIEHLNDAMITLNRPLTDGNAQQVMFWLGVAYLRRAETQNCCSRNTPDSCLLPIRGQGIHTIREGSTKAIECFEKLLKYASPSSLQYQNARWVLNIAYMTLDNYPQGVPAEYLLPPPAFASDEEFPRFMNIAQDLGVNALNAAGSVVADDFNGDGHLDLLVSQMDLSGQLRYWTNDGKGHYVERTAEAGLSGFYGGLNLVQADFNNDGHLDVLVLRGAWMGIMGRHPNSLLRNNGDGTFTDISHAAGLGDVHYPTQTASWADFDNDGDLDLYIGNESSEQVYAPSQLFRNNGDETFTDIAESAGVTNVRFAKGVVWGDYNQDCLPDIYVSNLRYENRLYRNNGDGTFVDVAPMLNVAGPIESFPVWFWDYDNDGLLDIYVSAYQIHSGHLALQAAGQSVPGIETQKLYRGNRSGGFDDVSASCGLNEFNAPMGANFGDLDNDGYLDFYLGTGRPDYWEIMPNVMYRNRRGTGFSDVTTAGGFGNLQKGHGIAFADFDEDGDHDVFSQLGGAYPGDQYYNALFENPGFGNHFVTLRLVGTQSNRSAIGARIRLDIVENGTPRSIYRHVNSGGSFGANPLRQTIGIGSATVIEQIEIFWPTTGKTQRFAKVAANQALRIVENEEALAVDRFDESRVAESESFSIVAPE